MEKIEALQALPAPAMRRAIREGAGVSQQDIADAMEPKVSRTAVSRWESGDRRPAREHLRQYVGILRTLQQGRS